LAPGLLESAYDQCLARELALSDIQFQVHAPLPLDYKGVRLECGYRVDLFVEKQVPYPCSDFCVVIFNLLGWKEVAHNINGWSGEELEVG